MPSPPQQPHHVPNMPSASSVAFALYVIQCFTRDFADVFDSYVADFEPLMLPGGTRLSTAASMLIELSLLERFIDARPNLCVCGSLCLRIFADLCVVCAHIMCLRIFVLSVRGRHELFNAFCTMSASDRQGTDSASDDDYSEWETIRRYMGGRRRMRSRSPRRPRSSQDEVSLARMRIRRRGLQVNIAHNGPGHQFFGHGPDGGPRTQTQLSLCSDHMLLSLVHVM